MKRDNFTIVPVEVRHAHMFCGLGGGAKGFNKARPRVGNMEARFRTIGGIDVDPAGIRDFGRLTGVAGTVLDLFDLDQYLAFHGHMPPPGWREATTADIHRAYGGERPHIIFLSAPCKGFSGLLSETKSLTGKYQALNRLTLRGVWLMLEAYKDDPVEMILFENVPRIATRGRHLLDQITSLLRSYGYAVAETTHDCGEIGGLAQSRKRLLLVARHMEKVPPFLYEPTKRPLRAVGDVLGRMALPGDLRAGPMHRVPSLQWKTWVRLAFVEAGADWRSLNKLAVQDGQLRDYLIVPEYRGGFLGVRAWDRPMGTVAGESGPTNGAFSVADPRAAAGALQYQQYGVLDWAETAGAVIGVKSPGQGTFSVADPRVDGERHGTAYRVAHWDKHAGTVTGDFRPAGGGGVADPRHAGPAKHSNEYRIVPWDRASMAVTSAHGTDQAVADPRPEWDGRHGHMHVAEWDRASRTVTAGGKGVQSGYLSVADPRPGMRRAAGDAYLTAGHYGVQQWDQPAGAVSAAAGHDNGRWSVADPRKLPNCAISQSGLPAAADKLVCRIQARDGTWHRPFTTLELAALQSLVDPEEQLELDGLSDQAWRERIGNAVPAEAATAIAEVMGTTLLLAWQGETFTLSSQPIWVRQLAVALAVGGAT